MDINLNIQEFIHLGSLTWNATIGLQWRLDATNNSELSHTKDRIETLNQLAYGDIEESNYGLYMDQSFQFGTQWSGNIGLRYDHFNFIYRNKLTSEYDKLLVNKNIVSPKLNLNYKLNSKISFNGHAGYGFHSNDTRVNVNQTNRDILPKALGFDFGFNIKPIKNLLLTATLWQLDLDQEFVYVGDAAIVEPSGKTTRHGVEVSLRYQIARALYFDTDINYTKARAIGEAKGQDYIPLAAKWSSIGGITLENKKGFNGSLRYRYLGDRSANEDHSIIAKGYVVFDALLNYTKDKWEIGISVQNLLNTDWKEAQFETESRLQNESESVTEIHFTPGTHLFLKSHLTIYF
ncbi:MAG: TonB-dependent receptor [Saprospiraceae bacterium]|nr:TonB-dependent receptor [Candidatus Defluviibacterium haderslevense]